MRKRLLILFILSLAAFMTAGAQTMHRRIPQYSFIRSDHNRIQTPSGKSPDFQLFLRKLDTLIVSRSGDVKIVHVGGSHVQGGVWTQQLRRNMLSLRYGLDGGRGMVFPFAAASTNTPIGYVSTCSGVWSYSRCLKPQDGTPLGVTGMAVETSDSSATIGIELYEREAREWTPGFTFKSMDVLGYGTARPVAVLGRDTLDGVFTGRGYHFDLPHYTDWIKLAFKDFPGTWTLTGIYLDRPQNGLTISEIGVNGASTSSFLNCRDFEMDMRMLDPDLVIFSIGINDIQGAEFNADRFIRNYSNLVKAVKRVNPHCAILFTSNSDSYSHHLPNRQGVDSELAFARLATMYDAAFWDLFDIMGGLGSIASWESAGLAKADKIHFTPAGYDILGDLLFNALMESLRQLR